MDTLYTWATPNGLKPLLMFEELGSEYRCVWINLGQDAQHAPDFLRRNPNGKIPVLVTQHNGASFPIWESGAILQFLAERSGRYLAASGIERVRTQQWLNYQVSSVGPMFGQLHHFQQCEPRVPYAEDRFEREARRILAVMEQHLAGTAYFGGSDYSIADMMIWPWVREVAILGLAVKDDSALGQWIARVAARPATQRALKILDAGEQP